MISIIIFLNEEVKFVENVSMKEYKGLMYVEARSCFFILYLFGEQILILSEKSQSILKTDACSNHAIAIFGDLRTRLRIGILRCFTLPSI